MDSVEVGIRELRLNLSRYVARVREGTEVVVTDRGEPVARLSPIDRQEAHIARLMREGVVKPAKRPKGTTPLPPPVPMEGDGPLASEIVLRDRR
jgi:prevent-host-death family protein